MSDLKSLILNPALNITVIKDGVGLDKLKDFFQREREFGFDIETNPVKDFWWRTIRTAQFGTAKEQFVVDLWELCGKSKEVLCASQGNFGTYINPLLQKFLSIVRPVLCTSDWLKVGVNLGFEYMCFYWSFGLRITGLYDCSIAERCIYAGLHSLKDYGFYSMADMAARYLNVAIEKEYQTSFTLERELSDGQVKYGATDTRVPLGIKTAQTLVAKGHTASTHPSPMFGRIDGRVTGDNLEEIIQIENNVIGAFIDMHLHGERMDKEKWLARVDKRKQELAAVLKELDSIFLPVVGSKHELITDEQIETSKLKWKTFNVVSDKELALKKLVRKDPSKQAEINLLELERKAQKEVYKQEASELGKRRTKLNNLAKKCEGDALINYDSNVQLLEVLKTMPGLKNIRDTDDTTLEKHAGKKVIDLLRVFREVSKDISTYGEQWVTCWTDSPGKEQGWLHPMDGRLHSKFNQYDAETGRSSSEAPNGQNIPKDKNTRSCFIADPPDELYPEGYDLLTIDMSGAELRILAEEANEPVWIEAFAKDQDVHAICAEMVEGQRWFQLALPTCKYFSKNPLGEYNKFKCSCPEHDDARNGMKSTNFGLPYGIGPRKLANQIKKSYTDTLELLSKHKKAFPALWVYLDKSGKNAVATGKSFDMFGRRRIFVKPTWAIAKKKALEDRKADSVDVHQIGNAFQALGGSIERQGKNHRIQSANATIIKIAMAALWVILPYLDAKLLKMVHDELVILCPKRYSQLLADITQEEIRKAAEIKMKKVVMKSDYHIEAYWCK